jgi:hypothetical protein
LIRSLLVATLFASAAPPEVPAPDVSAPYGMGIHFDDTATQVQRVPLGQSRRVVIECFCPVTAVKHFGARDEITLTITGRYSISGYHGSREDAGAEPIPRGGLHFRKQESGGSLRLVSSEFHYIHHSMYLSEVNVRAPEGVEVVFDKQSLDQIEERNNR